MSERKEIDYKGDIAGWLRHRSNWEHVLLSGKLAGEIADHIELLQAQRDADKADADRYRFLSGNFESNWDRKTLQYAWFYNNRGELHGESFDWPELDANIDAAIQRESQP